MNIPFLKRRPRVAIIRLSGVIGGSGRFGSGLSDAGLATVMARAFAMKPVAVALVINSPGGSPVQSALIGARIRRLAEEKKIPVHAFVEDLAASGGYWLACAADDIWIDDSSVVGSIGVISSSFGLVDLMTRNGVERRVHTAGLSKSLGDPFQPQKPEDVVRLRAILDPIHRNFIHHVTSRRGARLATDIDLFQGDVWVGQGAVDVGLADGIGHAVPRLKSLYGDKVRLVMVEQRRSIWQRFGAGATLSGAVAAVIGGTADVAEERALWARYGM